MKIKRDIHPEAMSAEIEATMKLASEIQRVEPSSDLKGIIMARLEEEKWPVVIPFYRRVGFAAAAAVLILAVNAVTLATYLRPSSTVENSADQTDRYSEIRAAYSLDESID